MEVIYLRSFLNDIKKIRDKDIKSKVKSVLENLENAAVLEELPNVKKLKGYSNVFRVRIGDYRMGFYKNEEKIEVARFLKRDDIYKVFP
jgi:mRNA interferase RelE/StbE